MWVTYSAQGATSLPQIGAVAVSCEQMREVKRQLPEPVSKKSERRKGSRVIQSSNHASIEGLIVSSTSSAKLSRAGVSLCINAKPASNPHPDTASLHSLSANAKQ